MDQSNGLKLLENLSQEWTDLEVLNFLHSCPQMLKESFCFRTLMAYNIRPLGGDQVVMLYTGDNPRRSLLISLVKSDSSKSFLSSGPIIPTISYHLNITVFDFPTNFHGLNYAIRQEQERIKKQTGRTVNDQDALAILFRKGVGLVGAKTFLDANYKKKCYWNWVQKLISIFKRVDQNTWRQEQIFMLLKRMDEVINERMYNSELNSMQNLRYFAG